MKTFSLAVISASAIALSAGAASAATLNFEIDLANSSVTLTETGGGGLTCWITSCGIEASLAPGLTSASPFALGEGETESFDFIKFSGDGTTGLTGRSFEITATLAFTTPASSTTSGGSGTAYLLGGYITAGSLYWNDVPASIVLDDGSEITVNFAGGHGLLLDGKKTYTSGASVTVDSIAPIPLPAAGLLLLGGLGTLGILRRRTTGKRETAAA